MPVLEVGYKRESLLFRHALNPIRWLLPGRVTSQIGTQLDRLCGRLLNSTRPAVEAKFITQSYAAMMP